MYVYDFYSSTVQLCVYSRTWSFWNWDLPLPQLCWSTWTPCVWVLYLLQSMSSPCYCCFPLPHSYVGQWSEDGIHIVMTIPILTVEGKCVTQCTLTFSSIVLSVLTIFLFCNDNRWCDFHFKESRFVFMYHAHYADQHITVVCIVYMFTPLCSSVCEVVVTACKL